MYLPLKAPLVWVNGTNGRSSQRRTACQTCRKRKVKCHGGDPSCEYPKKRNRTPELEPKDHQPPSNSTCRAQTPSSLSDVATQRVNGNGNESMNNASISDSTKFRPSVDSNFDNGDNRKHKFERNGAPIADVSNQIGGKARPQSASTKPTPNHWKEDDMREDGVAYLALRREKEILAASPVFGQAKDGRKRLFGVNIGGETHVGVKWCDTDDPQNMTYGLQPLSKCVQLRPGDLERYNIPHGHMIKISYVLLSCVQESESLFRDYLNKQLSGQGPVDQSGLGSAADHDHKLVKGGYKLMHQPLTSQTVDTQIKEERAN